MQNQSADAAENTDIDMPAGAGGGATYAAFPEGTDTEAAYQTALKFLTDAKIADGDDADPRPSAALSGLDYGLRNLIALRAAAVDQVLAEAKKRVPAGQSVAQIVAAEEHAAKEAAKEHDGAMSTAVLNHLQATKDYKDLDKMFEDNKGKAGWLDSDTGKAVAAQRAGMIADAAAVTTPKDKNDKNYGLLVTQINGKTRGENGVSLEDLHALNKKGEFARPEAIAQNIGTAVAQDEAVAGGIPPR